MAMTREEIADLLVARDARSEYRGRETGRCDAVRYVRGRAAKAFLDCDDDKAEDFRDLAKEIEGIELGTAPPSAHGSWEALLNLADDGLFGVAEEQAADAEGEP